MKQEFEERANFKVSTECYHTFIEPGYNASNLDKDEWVKEWKKNGGVQAAYDWECAKRIKAEKAAKGAEGEKTNMAKALIKKADQFNDEEMNRMAIAIIGERDYLVYKLENQLKLTKDDKKRILNPHQLKVRRKQGSQPLPYQKKRKWYRLKQRHT